MAGLGGFGSIQLRLSYSDDFFPVFQLFLVGLAVFETDFDAVSYY
jgi:hypothetical protein